MWKTNRHSSQGCPLQAGCWGLESKAPKEQWGFAGVVDVVGMGQLATGRDIQVIKGKWEQPEEEER